MVSPHEAFHVLARGDAPSAHDIRRAVSLGVSESYVEWIQGGADLELEHTSGLDVRIWAPDGLVEMNAAYDVRNQLGGGVAIGDAFGLFLVERQDGLFAVGAGALDAGELRIVAADLNAMLSAGELGELL